MAFPEVQNDGTVEVSDTDTINFGEGLTATNPSSDTAKIVGPKNTNESTSYDEVRFLDSGATTVTTSTTSITDDSGESGTRLDVTIDSTDTDTQDPIDVELNGSTQVFNCEDLNFVDTGTNADDNIDLSSTVSSSDVDIEFSLSNTVSTGSVEGTSFLKSDELRTSASGPATLNVRDSGNTDNITVNSSAFQANSNVKTDELRANGDNTITCLLQNGNDAVNVKANGLWTTGGTMFSGSSSFDFQDSSGGDTITVKSNIFNASTRVESDALRGRTSERIDAQDSSGNTVQGEIGSFTTIYAAARGDMPSGGSLTTKNTLNCSISQSTNSTSGAVTITVNFDNSYGSSSAYYPVAIAELQTPTLVSTSTGSCDILFNDDPGEFAIVICSWDSTVF